MWLDESFHYNFCVGRKWKSSYRTFDNGEWVPFKSSGVGVFTVWVGVLNSDRRVVK